MMTGDGGAAGAAELAATHGAVAITINNQQLEVSDPFEIGRQILSAGGFDPAPDHILIRILRHGAVVVGLDEEVDLRKGGPFVFKAFESDRSYNFTIDDRGYVWGAPTITEEELREITGLDDDKVFVLERTNKPDLDIESDDVVHLDKGGTEHLHTRKGMVTVWIDDTEKQIPRGVYTTEQLIEVLGVQPGYVLDVIKDGQLVSLKPGDKIRVKKDMHFVSQVPCGGSS
ncbi:MAG: multiubiquitin domain-containing protein [Hyphomicrobium sp.]|nr:multiubiquitin domain-containing protein [Hyphomicrobium sp.]